MWIVTRESALAIVSPSGYAFMPPNVVFSHNRTIAVDTALSNCATAVSTSLVQMTNDSITVPYARVFIGMATGLEANNHEPSGPMTFTIKRA